MHRVVVALDSFKGSIDATRATAALSRGLRRHHSRPAVREQPVADGGEGTLDAFEAAGFTRCPVEAADPLGRPVESGYVHRDGVAIVELADASGLSRVPEPAPVTALAASSHGTGRVIAAALDAGHRTVVVGLGGSATTDGGTGLVAALGGRLLDRANRAAPLTEVRAVDLSGLHPRLTGPDAARLVAACDVDNPLLGSNGAAAVYGPQKGADASAIAELESALGRWAGLLESATGTAVSDHPGAGAAGGAGFALLALGGQLRSGIELVLELTGFAGQLAGADLVITGEGSLDRQTLRGKAPAGVAAAARAAGAPVVAVAGRNQLAPAELAAAGFTAAFALTEVEADVGRCLREPEPLLERIGERIAAEFLVTAPISG
ncbi:glycerate kinase [Saccharopolyspora kobensis]|uniref:Glycerate kinase n=1 Tax=Saccharopolyspora kobensis TaxID=146035 RepID=A0A1H5T2Z5_9PSEU|nr:glycerate kinase [Saccharopolyspora kobensis]SEF57149.1 glycerate kinase [Saccharopolyspora kobensis]SFC50953.1 glycerate kinase [Saccharopolyspora kobensis]